MGLFGERGDWVKVGALGLMGLLLGGCGAPLLSENPAVRLQAVAGVEDDETLGLIALGLGRSLKYDQAGKLEGMWIGREAYQDDVREAAAKRVRSPYHLMVCAAFRTGEVYVDPAFETGVIKVRGEWLTVEREQLRAYGRAVTTGDAVQQAAQARLESPEGFADLCAYLEREKHRAPLHPWLPPMVFPFPPHPRDCAEAFLGSHGSAFYDAYENRRADNPLTQALCKAIDGQSPELARRFAVAAWPLGGKALAPVYIRALERAESIPEASAREALTSFRALAKESEHLRLPGPQAYHLLYRQLSSASSEEALFLLEHTSAQLADEILSRVRADSDFTELFCRELFHELATSEQLDAIALSYDDRGEDYLPERAKALIAHLKSDEARLKVAKESPSYALREAAILAMAREETLEKVVLESLGDVPLDLRTPEIRHPKRHLNLYESYRVGRPIAEQALRTAALERISNVATLKRIREHYAKHPLSAVASRRLSAIGYSEVDAIIAAQAYTPILFSQLAQLTTREACERIAQEATLRGVRLMAARCLGIERLRAIAQREVSTLTSRCPKNQLDFDGFYLGQPIEEIYARFAAELPELRPFLYLDGDVLCLAADHGRDLAWAKSHTVGIHWLTLPAELLKARLDLQNGTYSDLERALERKYHLDFSHETVAKGNIRQTIGNMETLAGETCRFFRSDLAASEDFGQVVRQASSEAALALQPQADTSLLALASAFEAVEAAERNASAARDYRFSPRGSIQLQWTRNAPKCSTSDGMPSSGERFFNLLSL